MEKSKVLINLLRDVLNKKLKIIDFIKKYKDYYIDNEKEINSELNTEDFEILSELHDDLDFFEPDPGLNKENDLSMNEEELLDLIKKTYNKVKEHLS